MADVGSAFEQESFIRVRKVSDFTLEARVKAVAAVDAGKAWVLCEPCPSKLGPGQLQPLYLVEKDGKILLSACLQGPVQAFTADGKENSYFFYGNKLFAVNKDGEIRTLVYLKGQWFYSMACHKIEETYELYLCANNFQIDVYSCAGEYLRSVEVDVKQQGVGRLIRRIISRDGIMEEWTDELAVDPRHYNIKHITSNTYIVYDYNGKAKKRASKKKTVYTRDGPSESNSGDGHDAKEFLPGILLDSTGTTIIDVQNNSWFQCKMRTVKGDKAKSPVDVLLEDVGETLLLPNNPLMSSRGFDSSIWILEGNKENTKFVSFLCW